MQSIVKNYGFWLAAISLACMLAERIAPWRKDQKLWRGQMGQDIFWLLFNGYAFAIVFGIPMSLMKTGLNAGFGILAGTPATALKLISQRPIWQQAILYLLIADFIEWCVHNMLHRNNLLWKFHRVHHSIITMDWIGNFRFHWAEIFIYNFFKYIPLALLGAKWQATLTIAVIATAIGHINHSNLNISWGPLRYILNSPRMHIWHHDKNPDRPAGYNFAVVFSMWDWIFKTAYMPREARMPQELGFRNQEKAPDNLLTRFFIPWANRA